MATRFDGYIDVLDPLQYGMPNGFDARMQAAETQGEIRNRRKEWFNNCWFVCAYNSPALQLFHQIIDKIYTYRDYLLDLLGQRRSSIEALDKAIESNENFIVDAGDILKNYNPKKPDSLNRDRTIELLKARGLGENLASFSDQRLVKMLKGQISFAEKANIANSSRLRLLHTYMDEEQALFDKLYGLEKDVEQHHDEGLTQKHYDAYSGDVNKIRKDLLARKDLDPEIRRKLKESGFISTIRKVLEFTGMSGDFNSQVRDEYLTSPRNVQQVTLDLSLPEAAMGSFRDAAQDVDPNHIQTEKSPEISMVSGAPKVIDSQIIVKV